MIWIWSSTDEITCWMRLKTWSTEHARILLMTTPLKCRRDVQSGPCSNMVQYSKMQKIDLRLRKAVTFASASRKSGHLRLEHFFDPNKGCGGWGERFAFIGTKDDHDGTQTCWTRDGVGWGGMLTCTDICKPSCYAILDVTCTCTQTSCYHMLPFTGRSLALAHKLHAALLYRCFLDFVCACSASHTQPIMSTFCVSQCLSLQYEIDVASARTQKFIES